jgi:DNA-binding CsgD family transcriptional regulator
MRVRPGGLGRVTDMQLQPEMSPQLEGARITEPVRHAGRTESKPPLIGRIEELATIEAVLDRARSGEGGALILRGEPGIGLTALLEYAAGSASAMSIARASGAEAEMDVPFAGVHQLFAQTDAQIAELPFAQRRAIEIALGRVTGGPPGVLVVGAAVLSLLCGMAVERPLLCAIDDAELLDLSSRVALTFAARRLSARGVVVLFAVHDAADVEPTPLDGFPQLVVGGLSEVEAGSLCESVVGAPLDRRSCAHLAAGTRGNPLAILELAREHSLSELGGGAPFNEPLPVGPSTKERFLGQVRDLPEDTRTLLLLASAQHDGDPARLWRAASRLGLSPDAASAGEDAQLARFAPAVEFCHPLVRASVYAASSEDARRAAHKALAEATDAASNPDVHLWHRAAAAFVPDELLSRSLARAAEGAENRGDHGTSGALLEHAARLSADPEVRGRRLLAAARERLASGSAEIAGVLLEDARCLPSTELANAQATRLQGAVACRLGRQTGTFELLLCAARELERLDTREASECYLDALEAAIYSAPVGGRSVAEDVARAALAFERDLGCERTAGARLLEGVATLIVAGHAPAMPTLRTAMDELLAVDEPRRLRLACLVALEIWDDASLHSLATRVPEEASRPTASVGVEVPRDSRASLDQIVGGYFAIAEEPLASTLGLVEGSDPLLSGDAAIKAALAAAWRGRLPASRELADRLWRKGISDDLGRHATVARYAETLLDIAHGDYRAAQISAAQVVGDRALYLSTSALPDLIEAAVRNRDGRAANSALERLRERTICSGTPWALGMLARSAALVSTGAGTEELYLEAVEDLGRCRARPHLARAHLVYGEWLRRERRRRDARQHLGAAYELFTSFGAEGFAQRALVELAATGEHRRPSTSQPRSALTPQELQVAQLAATGASNPEIAGTLFLSPRTVEYHLAKTYRKLGVRSRAQLGRILPN